jgi:hypothetical protein
MIAFPIAKVLDDNICPPWLEWHFHSDGRMRLLCEHLDRSLFRCTRLVPVLLLFGLPGRSQAASGCRRENSAVSGTRGAVAARDCQGRAHRTPRTPIGSLAQTSPCARTVASSQFEPYPPIDVMSGMTLRGRRAVPKRGEKACRIRTLPLRPGLHKQPLRL